VTVINDFYRVTDYCGSNLLMWETNWLLSDINGMIFIEWLTIVDSNLLMWETNWLLSDSNLLKTDNNWLFSDSN
jgi:predicted transglutaminase-like protease